MSDNEQVSYWRERAAAAERTAEALRTEVSQLTDSTQRLREEVARWMDRAGEQTTLGSGFKETIEALRTTLAEQRVSFLWGEKSGEWWLVVCRDGDPHEAYHPRHGAIVARRDTFVHWGSDAARPAVRRDHGDPSSPCKELGR